MKASYWDSLASSFDKEVFDPVAEDSKAIISSLVQRLSRSHPALIDIGCGNGRNMFRFHRLFKTVKGIDVSPACIRTARRRLPAGNQLSLECHDLLEPYPVDTLFDLALCVNVILDPDYSRRNRLFQNVFSLVKPAGRVLMVLPAVESVLHVTQRLIALNLNEYSAYRQAAAATNDQLGFTARSIRDGIIEKGGTATKHYLREELEYLYKEFGQKILSIEKVEYPWDSEIEAPPADMSGPYPWDWLVLSAHADQPGQAL